MRVNEARFGTRIRGPWGETTIVRGRHRGKPSGHPGQYPPSPQSESWPLIYLNGSGVTSSLPFRLEGCGGALAVLSALVPAPISSWVDRPGVGGGSTLTVSCLVARVPVTHSLTVGFSTRPGCKPREGKAAKFEPGYSVIPDLLPHRRVHWPVRTLLSQPFFLPPLHPEPTRRSS